MRRRIWPTWPSKWRPARSAAFLTIPPPAAPAMAARGRNRRAAARPAAANAGIAPILMRIVVPRPPVTIHAKGMGAEKTILILKPRGFCAGVVRAVEAVEQALDKFGPPI